MVFISIYFIWSIFTCLFRFCRCSFSFRCDCCAGWFFFLPISSLLSYRSTEYRLIFYILFLLLLLLLYSFECWCCYFFFFILLSGFSIRIVCSVVIVSGYFVFTYYCYYCFSLFPFCGKKRAFLYFFSPSGNNESYTEYS